MDYHSSMNLADYQSYLNFSLEQFQEYQLTQLKTFITSVKKYSPYYKNSLAGISRIDTYKNFETLPQLEQDDLRQTPINRLRGTDWQNITTISSSSGTTGKSKLVLWTKQALEEEAKWNALEYLLMGVTLESRLAMLMPLELSRCPSYLEACKVIGAFSVPFGRVRNDTEMDNIIEKIHILGVTHIHGSTSRLLSLTQRAKQLGYRLKTDFCVTHIFGSALFVSKTTRKYLQQEWGAQFFDCYGANEVSFVAGECSQHNGLHLLPGISYVEVVDEHTHKRITDSVTVGEVLITNFSNSGTPLVRYKVGDFGTISYKRCRCGLSFPRLFIKGRTAFTVYIGGTKLDAYDVDSALAQFPKLSNSYQAIVNKSHHKYILQFRIECFNNTSMSKSQKIAIQKALEKASYEILLKINEGIVTITVELLPLGALERTDRDKIKDQVVYMGA